VSYFARLLLLTLVIGGLLFGGSVFAQSDPTTAPTLLSAYYGLDDALPRMVNRICRGGSGLDGMPVIFSLPIDNNTLEPADFAVTTASGRVLMPLCVTLGPAVDTGELRTALMIGDFGDDETDPPITVEIVGEVLSGTGDPGAPSLSDPSQAVSFLGATVAVTPLENGPSLIYAEPVPLVDWLLNAEGQQGQGSGCPSSLALAQIVRVTWGGGVTRLDNSEATDTEREQYTVTVQAADGTTSETVPFALADLDDGDNHHLLCLSADGEPVQVAFNAGYLYDANHDTPNPATSVAVSAPVALADTTRYNMRNARYCEVIPTYRRRLSLTTQVWVSLGLHDCPQANWDALDEETLQAELGAAIVTLNGPRYWVVDELTVLSGLALESQIQTFGGLEYALRATIDLQIPDVIERQNGESAYQPNAVARDTRFVFYAGEKVYQLTAPDGNTYIMQSYSNIVDPTQTIDMLDTLGERLALPAGWSYSVTVLEERLNVYSGGEAIVLQDELQNSYQLLR
jgi:hypothetical protein